MSEFVSIEKKNKIAIITITREKALNALNEDVLRELKDAFFDVNNDKNIYAIILTGQGRAFVAGADIAYMQKLSSLEAREFSMLGQSVMNYIAESPKPVIAAINGFALGGGCELALACDIRLASEKALFGQPEVALGVMPGFGGTQRMSKSIGLGMAKYLIYSGENIDAKEALRIGLVQKVYPEDELISEAIKLAESFASKSPIGIKLSKSVINNGAEIDIRTAIQMEAENFGLCFGTEDQKEGMKAFLEKRKYDFQNK